jgi:hypothetical protein
LESQASLPWLRFSRRELIEILKAPRVAWLPAARCV